MVYCIINISCQLQEMHLLRSLFLTTSILTIQHLKGNHHRILNLNRCVIENPIREDKSSAAVAVGLPVNIDPSSSPVMMVEVSPEIPSSSSRLAPVPISPGADGTLVHEGHVEAVVELGPPGLAAEVALTEGISGVVVNQVVASDGDCDLDDSSGPSIVVSSIEYCEGGELDCDVVEGSLEGLGAGDADEGQLSIAGLVSFEGVAVVAGEASGPVASESGPDGGLEGQAFLDWFEAEFVHVGNASVVDGTCPAGQCQHQQDASHLICINYN